MDFLNDGNLEESFKQGRLVNLTVMDVGARSSRGKEYEVFTSWRRVIWFREFSQFYGGLVIFILIALAVVVMPARLAAP